MLNSNLVKNIERIFTEIGKLNNATKSSIRHGTILCLLVLAAGTAMIGFNHWGLNYDANFEFIATSVVKSGFTILAIVIIGSLLLDHVFKKS